LGYNEIMNAWRTVLDYRLTRQEGKSIFVVGERFCTINEVVS
jgi:hypothetical protein